MKDNIVLTMHSSLFAFSKLIFFHPTD